MSKVLYLDTETTGLTTNSAIIQIAGIIEIDGVVKEEFNIKCRPHENAEVSKDALEVTKLTLEEINKYQAPEDALKELETIFAKYCDKYNREDKFILVGHNVKFDLKMLNSFFIRLGNNYLGSWISFKKIFDTLAVIQAMQIIKIIPEMENNKLGTLSEYFKIELGDNAHDALADIKATRKLSKIIAKTLKK